MKNYRIAVLGSTGVVGREMIRLIEAGGIPAELVPLGSARSAGSTIEFHGEPVTVREATGKQLLRRGFCFGRGEERGRAAFRACDSRERRSVYRQQLRVPPYGRRAPRCTGDKRCGCVFASRHNRKPELLHDNRAHGQPPRSTGCRG